MRWQLGLVVLGAFWLHGCCDQVVEYDPEKRAFRISSGLSIGWETGTGFLSVQRTPEGEWGYVVSVNLAGPAAVNTKALAVLMASGDGYYHDRFVVYGDGRGTVYGPFEFLAPITVKEIYAKDTQARWPDYVLAPGYQLRSLRELEAYIRQHRHLPGLPTAQQVAERGVSLIETQRVLVEKVEELTLYVLHLQHQIDSLRTLVQTCR